MKATLPELEPSVELHANYPAETTAALRAAYEPLLVSTVVARMKHFYHQGVSESSSTSRKRHPSSYCPLKLFIDRSHVFQEEKWHLQIWWIGHSFKGYVYIMYSFHVGNAFHRASFQKSYMISLLASNSYFQSLPSLER